VNRPPLDVADIFRAVGRDFIDKSRRWLTWQHLKVLRAIEHCRTATLGGHVDSCSQCGHRAISFNSCRNRHCPKCQTNARDQWLAARAHELLPVPYFHVVFTLPHELSALALQNKRVLYDLLFRASAETLLEIAADPKHLGAHIGVSQRSSYLGAEPAPSSTCSLCSSRRRFGIGSLLLEKHTPAKLSPSCPRTQSCIPRQVQGRLKKCAFQQRKLVFCGGLQYLSGPNQFQRFLNQLRRKDWVVYATPPFGGPEHVLHYLARYTHRIAISNHRLLTSMVNT
jgi:hypothetical protein